MSGLSKFLGNAAKVVGTDVYSNMMNAGGSMIHGFVNEFFTDRARQKNYEMNEKAAKNADKRQREQYQDLYSPESMLQQYRAAGLSPSMMMSGGAPVVGGTATGNIGSGSSGGYPTPSNGQSNPMWELQMRQMEANIKNTDADTELKKQEKEIQDIDKSMKELTASKLSQEFVVLNLNLMKGETPITYTELANTSKDYDEFYKAVKEATKYADSGTQHYLSSEFGQQTLRGIYIANKSLKNDIAVLSSSEVNANFQKKLTQFLDREGYAEENAKAAVQQLKALGAESELSETQKNAWNNLIDKLGEGTWKDIIVVLGMILGKYVGNASVSINTGSSYKTTNNEYNKTWNKFAE